MPDASRQMPEQWQVESGKWQVSGRENAPCNCMGRLTNFKKKVGKRSIYSVNCLISFSKKLLTPIFIKSLKKKKQPLTKITLWHTTNQEEL